MLYVGRHFWPPYRDSGFTHFRQFATALSPQEGAISMPMSRTRFPQNPGISRPIYHLLKITHSKPLIAATNAQFFAIISDHPTQALNLPLL